MEFVVAWVDGTYSEETKQELAVDSKWGNIISVNGLTRKLWDKIEDRVYRFETGPNDIYTNADPDGVMVDCLPMQDDEQCTVNEPGAYAPPPYVDKDCVTKRMTGRLSPQYIGAQVLEAIAEYLSHEWDSGRTAWDMTRIHAKKQYASSVERDAAMESHTLLSRQVDKATGK